MIKYFEALLFLFSFQYIDSCEVNVGAMKIPVLLILFALMYYLDGRKDEESFEEKVEARNELKSYLYSLKNKVAEIGELRKFGAKLLDIGRKDEES